ncbi:MAG: FkbM family methyltransferase, partial [Candidatus Pelagibacter sp.]
MLKKRFLKLSRSLLKLILPITFKILIKLKLNRRVINYLHERSYNSNNLYDFTGNIKNLLKDKKIVALDVGAQGGFNSDNFFPSKYNYFFEDILIEPIESEINKLKEKKFVINKGVWSEKEKKKLFILDNRLGSSSMYKPDIKNFDLHEIKKDDYKNYDVTRTTEIECDSIKNLLSELDLKNLDYLKVDTQGAELEIIKGLGVYR